MDSATEFLFGASVDSLNSPLPLPGGSRQVSASHSNQFTAAFQDTLEDIVNRIRWRSSGWQLLEFFGDKTDMNMRVLYDFVDPIIDQAIAKSKKGEKEESKESLLAHMIDSTHG